MKKPLSNLTSVLVTAGLFFCVKVQAQVCPTFQAGIANIGGIINSYFQPSVSTLPSGSTSFTLLSGGTIYGASDNIAIGDLLLIIQIQDGAATDFGNTPTYGTIASTRAGQYEFVIATSAGTQAAGSMINFVRADGTSGGTYNEYVQSPTNPIGRQTYQIVKVPNYENVVLTNNLTALNWDGFRGGIVALRVLRNTDFNSSFGIDVMARGFRGAGATAVSGASVGEVYRSAVTTHGAVKGEGIAGTPSVVNTFEGVDAIATGTTYPNGSFMTGSPGNAGGGGKDDGPQPAICWYVADASDFNSGGGGGGNVGAGGRGGDSWCTGSAQFGLGGKSLSAYTERMFLGGGGGAGETQYEGEGFGGFGGGIVFFFTGTVTNTGVATAINADADFINRFNYDGIDYQSYSEAGGGGGAGGSVLAFSSGGLGSLSITARGGAGGNSTLDDPNILDSPTQSTYGEHGPGGGGGGGKIIHSVTSGTISVVGGEAGRFYAFFTASATVDVGTFGATDGVVGETASATSAPFPLPCLDILPVNLLSFTVTHLGNAAQLQWVTTSEAHNKGFEIQRSAEGVNWSTLGFVDAKSSNQTAQATYQFTDHLPYGGISYYRLKQIDLDDTYTYSGIARFANGATKAITVYPNPVSHQLSISGLSGKNTITITDVRGQVIIRLQTNGLATRAIDVSKLAYGTYFVTITNQQGLTQQFKVNKK